MANWKLSPEHIRHVKTVLTPMMRDSKVCVSICPPQNEPDPKFLLELGAAIWFNKPIIAVGTGGREMPEGIKRIASCVLENYDLDTAEGSNALQAALKECLQNLAVL